MGEMRLTALRVWISTVTAFVPFNHLSFNNSSLLLLETTCSAIRYQCNSGSCILKKNAKCDGIHDCQDRSDEADCSELMCEA